MKRVNSKLQEWRDSTMINNESQIMNEPEINLQWSEIKTSSSLLKKRSHHASAIIGNKMYIYGGYEAGGDGVLGDLMCFNLQTSQWKVVLKKSNILGGRQSHSLVGRENKLILFGGLMNTFQSSNKVYSFDVDKDSEWRQELCKGDLPPGLNSHKAVVYNNNNSMIVIGGQQQDKYNESIYSLDLNTKQWKKLTQLTKHNLTLRSDFSLNLYKDKLYLFGGKQMDTKYNQLWQYSLQNGVFRRILQNENSFFWPVARSGHCACVYKGCLVVFGGTTGVTHERNDLVVYNIQQDKWQRHWPDQQSQLLSQRQSQLSQPCYEQIQSQSRYRLSPMNTLQKKQYSGNTSQFSPNNNLLTQNNQSSLYYQQQQNSLMNNTGQDIKRKYRQPMKNQNYYNHNYPFYGDKQSLLANKHKKNDLLIDLQKETKQEMKHNNLQGGVKTQVIGKAHHNLHMSQTFQSITNTILSTFPSSSSAQNNNNNNNKITDLNQSRNQQKSYIINNNRQSNNKQTPIKQPKSRDGHTCEIYQSKMFIFGGDRHHMSFNDVIVVDLDRVLMKDKK